MLAKLKSSLKKVDLMSESPNLLIEGENSYKTAIGGLINVILVIVSLVGVVYFGKELWLKSEPKVVVSSMEGQKVGPFKFGKEDFMVYIGLEFSNLTYFTDPRIAVINVTFEQNIFLENGGQDYIINPLDSDICSKYYSQKDISKEENIDINNFFCVKPGNITFEGYWGQQRNTIIKFSIFKCINSTWNNNHCYPPDDINYYVNGGLLSMFTTNSFTSYNDPDKPVTLKLQNWFNSLNTAFSLSYYYKIIVLKFLDDKGFLLQEIKENNYPFFDNPLILYYGNRDKNVLGEVYVLGDKYGQKVDRSYTKIQDVLMRIGGLLKAFSIIAQFIANVSSTIEFQADSVFNFKYQLGNHNSSILENKKLTNSNPYLSTIYIQNNKISINLKQSSNEFKETNTNQIEKKEEKFKINCNFETKHAQNKTWNSKQIITYPLSNNNYVASHSNQISNKQDHYSQLITKNNLQPLEPEINSDQKDKSNQLLQSQVNDNLNFRNRNNEDIKNPQVLDNSGNINNLNKLSLERLREISANSMKFYEGHRSRLLSTTSSYYNCTGTKKYLLQIFDIIFLGYFENNKNIKDITNYSKKMRKLLSINYLFKKLFLLEILAKKTFSNEELELLHGPYIMQMVEEADASYQNFDDTDVFDLSKII